MKQKIVEAKYFTDRSDLPALSKDVFKLTVSPELPVKLRKWMTEKGNMSQSAAAVAPKTTEERKNKTNNLISFISQTNCPHSNLR